MYELFFYVSKFFCNVVLFLNFSYPYISNKQMLIQPTLQHIIILLMILNVFAQSQITKMNTVLTITDSDPCFIKVQETFSISSPMSLKQITRTLPKRIMTS